MYESPWDLDGKLGDDQRLSLPRKRAAAPRPPISPVTGAGDCCVSCSYFLNHGVGSTWNEANIISAVTSEGTTKVTFYAESFSPYMSGASTKVPVIPTPTSGGGGGGSKGGTIILPETTGGDAQDDSHSEFTDDPVVDSDPAVRSDDTDEEEEIIDTSLSDLVKAVVGGDTDDTHTDTTNSKKGGQTIILAAKELEKKYS